MAIVSGSRAGAGSPPLISSHTSPRISSPHQSEEWEQIGVAPLLLEALDEDLADGRDGIKPTVRAPARTPGPQCRRLCIGLDDDCVRVRLDDHVGWPCEGVFMEAAPSRRPMVFLERFGGAVARIPDDATAFGHRDAEYDLIIAGIWDDDAEQEAHLDWAKSFYQATEPYSTESVYVNYLSEEGEERVKSAYGGQHYARLVELKRRCDPRSVFRNNQNIRPDS